MEQTIRGPHVSMRDGGMESGREVGREGGREAGREGGREEGKDGSKNELIDECIAVFGSRNVIVVIAYTDNYPDKELLEVCGAFSCLPKHRLHSTAVRSKSFEHATSDQCPARTETLDPHQKGLGDC